MNCALLQAARALANLAAHGDSNGNNAAVGREAGALEALVHLTCSNHEGVRYMEFFVPVCSIYVRRLCLSSDQRLLF